MSIDDVGDDDWGVYQRPNSKFYWMRLRKPDGSGWIRESTKETSLNKAQRVALRAAIRLEERARLGMPTTSVSFAHAAEDYIAVLSEPRLSPKRGKSERYINNEISCLRRYPIAFFADKPIDEIDQNAIHDYMHWRLSYWASPENQNEKQTVTINGKPVTRKTRKGKDLQSGEMSWLREVFAHSVSRGWTSKSRIPDLSAQIRKPNPRPGIDVDLIMSIVNGDDGTAFIGKPRKDIDRVIRRKLMALIKVLLETGMRYGEAMSLRWCDVETDTIGSQFIKFNIRESKTTCRVVVGPAHLLADAIYPMQSMKEYFADPNRPLFSVIDGENIRMPDYGKVFAGLMKSVKERGIDPNTGRRFTLYSMRHAYISDRVRNGARVDIIAKATGTSPAMVKTFYDHSLPIHHTDELLKGVNERHKRQLAEAVRANKRK